jgi:sigma-B regulation protein RsbU (phosphoserine phosphatase)
VGILSRSYTNLIKNNNNYIENVKSLESEKERINTELNIAHKIQESMLPKKSINNDSLILEGFCKPAREVGGDFYDFYELDDENTMIMIGDASGKGVPAAIFTTIIQNLIKLFMKNELDPAKVLCDVNNQICENNPEMMFITLFLGIYNKKTHKLTYANAGHTHPLVVGNGKAKYIVPDPGLAIGLFPDAGIIDEELQIENGKGILLYTDGVVEAVNKDKQFYGEEKLEQLLETNESKSIENIVNAVVEDVMLFQKECEPFDDITILGLKRKS